MSLQTKRLNRGRTRRKLFQSVLLAVLLSVCTARCPWPKEVAELNASCECDFNEISEISVQCTTVHFSLLMTVLHKSTVHIPFDLLYINNSNVNTLNDKTFSGLTIRNIQFSNCGIYNISANTFEGLEDNLLQLNLQSNRMASVPSEAIKSLRRLTHLDLSNNKITNLKASAFAGLPLETLKLADNTDLVLHGEAFGGLEGTLKNLNLKGIGLTQIPPAVKFLNKLAFLDLAQNKINGLRRGSLSSLDSLTALNLERNLLKSLESDAFQGIEDTLSSISFLNNHIKVFPTAAINSLPQLRVLDFGFNLITKLPDNAFSGLNFLTLLALDGNPLSTIQSKAFNHLNNTLRGLTVGGTYLECDCKIAWITDWIREYDLQVTSRVRSPQFCGLPYELQSRTFNQLSRKDLNCEPPLPHPTSIGDVVIPPTRRPETTTIIRRLTAPKRVRTPTTTTTTTTTTEKPTTKIPTTSTQKMMVTTSRRPDPLIHRPNRLGSVSRSPPEQEERISKNIRGSTVQRPPPQLRPRKPASESTVLKRPLNIIQRNEGRNEGRNGAFSGQAANGPYIDEVIVQDAYRKDNSVIIQWDSEVSNILGFRVVYRLFGDKQFKLGPPLASTEREFKIRNVPSQECVVVCVVSLEDVNINPESVKYEQCREIRTESSAATHMDTIIIAASAAICGTVIIAVIVFICCNRRKGSRSEKGRMPSVLSPITPPLASLGALGNTHKADWDTISMYSQRSIPRARMYHMDKGSINNGFIPDDARSHISHMSQKSRARSMADGQSQRSYSALSAARNMGQVPYLPPMGLSRPDLRMSHQSLAHSQFGAFTPGLRASLSRGPSQRSERRRRPKSRERTSSRLSHAGSTHSLTGYDTDGWTDHDMEIYMARNPTKGGLVQL